MLTIIKWVVIIGILYVVFLVGRALVTKPNLRYYPVETLKQAKHLYNRYHV